MKNELCDYGRAIKHGLIDKGYSLEELAKLVSEKTGMYCDQPLLTRIIYGIIKADARPTITAAIDEILELKTKEE